MELQRRRMGHVARDGKRDRHRLPSGNASPVQVAARHKEAEKRIFWISWLVWIVLLDQVSATRIWVE